MPGNIYIIAIWILHVILSITILYVFKLQFDVESWRVWLVSIQLLYEKQNCILSRFDQDNYVLLHRTKQRLIYIKI